MEAGSLDAGPDLAENPFSRDHGSVPEMPGEGALLLVGRETAKWTGFPRRRSSDPA